jgi:hypothetical protein
MSSISYCPNLCPNYTTIPRDTDSCVKDPKATWKITTVQKTDENGHLVRNKKGEYHFDYMEEVATGNFYQMDEPERLGGVAGAILLFGWLYCGLNMAANFISIAVDIVGISIEALAKIGKEWKKLTKGEALANFALRIIIEIPIAVVQDIWGIVRAPFYTAAMMTVAVYGLFNPLGARPWYNKVEKHWHDGKGYEYDFRHHAPNSFKFERFWKGYREGKIVFMAYCCLKCGNRADPRFQLVKA